MTGRERKPQAPNPGPRVRTTTSWEDGDYFNSGIRGPQKPYDRVPKPTPPPEPYPCVLGN